MYRKVSKISLFFFFVYYNYILLRFLVFPHIYDNYGANGIYIIFTMLIILLVALVFLPKGMYQYDFYNKFQDSKIKYIVKPIFYLRSIFGLASCSFLLREMFFQSYPFWLILIGLVIVVGVISRGNTSDIIQISTLFGIVCTLVYILYFYDFINLDFTLITGDINPNWLTLIYILFLVLDNFNYFLVEKDKIELTKPLVMSSAIFTILIFAFEYMILVLAGGDKLFLNEALCGFISLSIQPVSRYNGNFRYVYILVITIAVVFKFSFFTSIVNIKEKSKIKNIIYYISYFIIGFLLYYLFKWNFELTKMIIMGLILSSVVLLIWLIKEAYNARLDER